MTFGSQIEQVLDVSGINAGWIRTSQCVAGQFHGAGTQGAGERGMAVDIVEVFERGIESPSIVEIAEYRDRLRFVPASGVCFEFHDRSAGRSIAPCIAVRAEAGHGIEAVDDREPAGGQRNLFAGEAVGVPASVNPFMMTSNDIENQRFSDFHATETFMSGHRVLLDDLEFLGIQPTRFPENLRGYIDLAEIVENRTQHEIHESRGVESGGFRHGLSVHRHSPSMSRSTAVLQFDDAAEGVGEFEIHGWSLAPSLRLRQIG